MLGFLARVLNPAEKQSRRTLLTGDKTASPTPVPHSTATHTPTEDNVPFDQKKGAFVPDYKLKEMDGQSLYEYYYNLQQVAHRSLYATRQMQLIEKMKDIKVNEENETPQMQSMRQKARDLEKRNAPKDTDSINLYIDPKTGLMADWKIAGLPGWDKWTKDEQEAIQGHISNLYETVRKNPKTSSPAAKQLAKIIYHYGHTGDLLREADKKLGIKNSPILYEELDKIVAERGPNKNPVYISEFAEKTLKGLENQPTVYKPSEQSADKKVPQQADAVQPEEKPEETVSPTIEFIRKEVRPPGLLTGDDGKTFGEESLSLPKDQRVPLTEEEVARRKKLLRKTEGKVLTGEAPPKPTTFEDFQKVHGRVPGMVGTNGVYWSEEQLNLKKSERVPMTPDEIEARRKLLNKPKPKAPPLLGETP